MHCTDRRKTFVDLGIKNTSGLRSQRRVCNSPVNLPVSFQPGAGGDGSSEERRSDRDGQHDLQQHPESVLHWELKDLNDEVVVL